MSVGQAYAQITLMSLVGARCPGLWASTDRDSFMGFIALNPPRLQASLLGFPRFKEVKSLTPAPDRV